MALFDWSLLEESLGLGEASMVETTAGSVSRPTSLKRLPCLESLLLLLPAFLDYSLSISALYAAISLIASTSLKLETGAAWLIITRELLLFSRVLIPPKGVSLSTNVFPRGAVESRDACKVRLFLASSTSSTLFY